MEWGLSAITFGTIDIFTSFVALITLRRRDFFYYLLATSPSVIVNYISYGSFYVTSGSQVQDTLILSLVYGIIFGVWHPLSVNIVLIPICTWMFLSSWRTRKVAHHTNILRKYLKLKPRLYPDMKFKERVKKRDFGDRVTLMVKVVTAVEMSMSIFLLVSFNYVFFQMHQVFVVKGSDYINCWQMENNQTIIQSFFNTTNPQRASLYFDSMIYNDFITVMDC